MSERVKKGFPNLEWYAYAKLRRKIDREMGGVDRRLERRLAPTNGG